MVRRIASLAVVMLWTSAVAAAEGDLLQVQQDFANDPHWEGMNNRVACDNCPTIHQDFGWSPTKKFGGDGAISGTIWRSRTPAYFAAKVGPFSFDDSLSASGRVAVMPAKRVDGFYFGFFNSARQEWRPWSSLAVRIGDIRSQNPPAAEVIVDYMPAGWKAGGYTVGLLPIDGKPRKWALTYEPDVTVPKEWTDTKLREWLGDVRRPEAELLKRAQADDPAITIDKLLVRIQAASKLGLVEYHERRGTGWEIRRNPERVKGRILCTLEDGLDQANFLDDSIRKEPATFDRFGVFNFQLPGGPTDFALSELTINGKKVDLSSDPNWDAKGNKRKFVEHDFHARQDFGFSQTNFASKASGEIGGTFWRTEPIDPLHAYYADEIGQLTLDDPMSFSGQVAFTAGGTDAGMMFGYFNSKEAVVELKEPESGAPMPQTMVLAIEGPTRIGYQFSAQLAATRKQSSHSDGPIFVPNGKKHPFTFKYDPSANDGVGRITMSIDDDIRTLDLSRKQRAAGAKFDRFGLLNIRRGGKYVTVYLDDLSYTARRSKVYRPTEHEQKVVHVPYPENGRKY